MQDVVIQRGTVLASLCTINPKDLPPKVDDKQHTHNLPQTMMYTISSSLRQTFKEKLQHLPQPDQDILNSLLSEFSWLFEEWIYLPATSGT